jgi:hypothetical protein
VITATPMVTVGVPRGIIPHGALVLVRVRTRPDADAIITLRLTRRGERCTGSAQRRVCASVTTVLAQGVVYARANRQGLVTQRVPPGYTPTSTLRATLSVQVRTRYGALTHAAVVLIESARPATRRPAVHSSSTSPRRPATHRAGTTSRRPRARSSGSRRTLSGSNGVPNF